MRRINELFLSYPFYGSRQMVRRWHHHLDGQLPFSLGALVHDWLPSVYAPSGTPISFLLIS